MDSSVILWDGKAYDRRWLFGLCPEVVQRADSESCLVEQLEVRHASVPYNLCVIFALHMYALIILLVGAYCAIINPLCPSGKGAILDRGRRACWQCCYSVDGSWAR
jgi:hypothetical protein